MAEFEVKVRRLTIVPHENADKIEIAQVDGFQSIVRKGEFKTGELAVYIPEAAVVPDAVLKEMGLEGRLAGSQKNRVKPVKLRGVLSEGLIYPNKGWKEGQDVAELLGIKKWEPKLPSSLSKFAQRAKVRGSEPCIKYDIENFKKYVDVIVPGEGVVMTEKIHGTWCQVGVLPTEDYRLVISSKGLASRGVAFSADPLSVWQQVWNVLRFRPRMSRKGYPETFKSHEGNVYVETALRLNLAERARVWLASFAPAFADTEPVYVLGEVFGAKIQDLEYGCNEWAGDPSKWMGFRVFDIYVGWPQKGRYLDFDELEFSCKAMGLPLVPVLYRGPFTREVLDKHTNGKETISGKSLHVREGVVVRPTYERRDRRLGRVQLKSVSAAYLLRAGNQTDFQ